MGTAQAWFPPALSLWSAPRLRTERPAPLAYQSLGLERAGGGGEQSIRGCEVILRVDLDLRSLSPARAVDPHLQGTGSSFLIAGWDCSRCSGGESETPYDDKEPNVRLQGLPSQERKDVRLGKVSLGSRWLSFPHPPESFTVLGEHHSAARCLCHFSMTDGWLSQLGGNMQTA